MSQWRSGSETIIIADFDGVRVPLSLGAFLGDGNSGEVFELENEQWQRYLVAKLYFPGKQPVNLHALVSEVAAREVGRLGGRGSDPDKSRYSPLATPKAVVYRNEGAQDPCGLLLSRVDPARFMPLDAYLTSSLKRNLEANLNAAECLAEIVDWLHAREYVIGDISGTNIRVDREGYIAILDVDSFGILGSADVPTSGDSSVNFQAPEGGATQESDRFTFGMIIIQLLLRGASPFAGSRGELGTTLQDNISARDSWLFDREHFLLPRSLRSHPGLAVLPPHSRTLARATLRGDPRLRPTASAWSIGLDRARVAMGTCDQCGAARFDSAACAECGDGAPEIAGSAPRSKRRRPVGAVRARGRATAFADQPAVPNSVAESRWRPLLSFVALVVLVAGIVAAVGIEGITLLVTTVLK